MSEYQITCCSTADMPAQYFEEKKIPFVCFNFLMDGVQYPDDLGKSMPFDEFYKKIANGAEPTTAQVNTQQYMELFEPILQKGLDILHLTLSSGISGSINSANIAKAQMEEKYPDRKVMIIDSLAASSGYGMLVDMALTKQQEGLGLEENAAWLEENRNKLHHWFFSTDLTSFIRGGRISKVSGFVGQALNICPLMNVNSEGKLIPRSKYRGKKQVIREMVKRMEEHAKGGLDYSGKCFISCSACEEDARKVADMIEEKFPNLDGKVLINSIGTVIGAHTGPGTVALFFWGDERTI
ncbi:MAG TPA: DegV family protein [Candidatus Blautia stercoravium]|nr:DegV family protein [Candidatus Blautia stercoravium]